MSTANNTADDHIVQKPSPHFSTVLVKKSPTVAPSGLVSTKASQNNTIGENFVYLYASAISAMLVLTTRAHPANHSPELSARKSPNAVPNVLDTRIAIQ